MKRKEPLSATEEPRRTGRRQPQTSCLNCRTKKIKCDRGAPCAACTIRGIPCTGQPGPMSVVVPYYNGANPVADASILSRLTSLEKAVFGDSQNGNTASVSEPIKSGMGTSSVVSTQVTAVDTPSPMSHKDVERQQAAKFLDLTYTRDDHRTSARTRQQHFYVAPISSHPKPLMNKYGQGIGNPNKSIFFMAREEALLLLDDFFDNPYHLLPIVYEPSARYSINKFYTQLEQGQEGDAAAAALILSIAATSASFFSPNATKHNIFPSIEEAIETSVVWRQAALAILDDPQFPLEMSLERCQARTILAYAVVNVEGCSAHYRFLHAGSVAVARDMSLHLIDSKVSGDTSDDIPTREIKRRLWWHLASTDWLLGLVGGPLDGTYTINPRHFIVNRPRNLNDNDLSQSDETLTYPLNVPTRLSCFLQRIRLGETCRDMIDARPPGHLDVEITDFDTVTSLDQLFQKVLVELPPFLQEHAPIPEGAPPYFAQQRDLILLCYHFRRARLHRPFLLHETDNPRYEPSRRQCIASARTVLSVSIELLDESSAVNENHPFGNPLAYRAGLVISSMFTACTVLALNAGIIWNRTTGDARNNARPNEATSEIHSEITRACRVLAKVGEKSNFAANLLRNLIGVLKQYSVKEIDDIVPPPTKSNPNTAYTGDNADATFDTYIPEDQLQSMGEPMNVADNFTMWNEFFTTMPDMEGYDQLFAGLDHYCGPAY